MNESSYTTLMTYTKNTKNSKNRVPLLITYLKGKAEIHALGIKGVAAVTATSLDQFSPCNSSSCP